MPKVAWCTSVLLLLSAALSAQQRVQIDGSVKAGESFIQDVGQGLQFAVRPTDNGFEIRIELKDPPPQMKDNDLTRCVTPPYHGPNPRDVDASKFVDQDNQELPPDELKQGFAGDIYFVTSYVDDEKACKELNTVLYTPPKHGPDGEVILGMPGYVPPATGHVEFRILKLPLAELGKGKTAKIAFMRFAARVDLPAKAQSRRSK